MLTRWIFFLVAIACASSAAWAQPSSCAVPGKDGTAYTAPSYYPGSATAAASQRNISLGTLRTGTNAGTSPIAVGDLVMVIQMQDAQHNNGNAIAFW